MHSNVSTNNSNIQINQPSNNAGKVLTCNEYCDWPTMNVDDVKPIRNSNGNWQRNSIKGQPDPKGLGAA